MSSLIARALTNPKGMPWWGWPKIAGGLVLLLTLAALIAGAKINGWLLGWSLHLCLDFTLQSQWMSDEKDKRGRALIIHSIIAGGLPGAVAGIMTSELTGCLIGVVVGIITHYIIDYSRKFGIRDWLLAITIDQICHVAVLVIMVKCLLLTS